MEKQMKRIAAHFAGLIVLVGVVALGATDQDKMLVCGYPSELG
jgi:hypothetical protein